MQSYLANLWMLTLDAAPFLVLGLVAAGLVRALLPTERVAALMGGRGLKPIGWAALIGAPMPLCSCGVLPAAMQLRRAGASKGATGAFLVSTPETGVDQIALSWALLGPAFALIRPVAGLVSSITAGLLIERWSDDNPAPVKAAAAAPCCAHDHHHAHGDAAHTHAHAHEHGHVHAGHAHDGHTHDALARPDAGAPLWQRLANGQAYAFSALLDDIALWLAGGLAVAALIVTLVPPSALAAWGSGPVAMLLMLLVATPMYVCANAATPLAHAMLHAGVSPGTALVFLLAGPATNIAGLLIIRRELGTGAMWAFLAGVCGSAMAMGLAIDALWPNLWAMSVGAHDHDHAHTDLLPQKLAIASTALLVLAAIPPVRRAVSAVLPYRAARAAATSAR